MSLTLLLSSCAHPPLLKPQQNSDNTLRYQQHLAKIALINHFNLKGRIGIQANGKGFSGTLTWQHEPSADNIQLFSPLGGQVASIVKTATQVTMTNAAGNSISAADVESLMQLTLGWQLPLTGLVDWCLGRPSKSMIQASNWNADGFLQQLKQDDWQIDYQQYTNQHLYALPNKLTLRKNGMFFKLLIDDWGTGNQENASQ